LLLPEVLSPAEIERLHAELPTLYRQQAASRVLEKGSDVVRSIYGTHTDNELFGRLVRHPALVEPAQQILGSGVYVYQFKVNAKAALVGDVWEWHQDYIFWLKEDGLAECRILNVAVFLDDVTEINGPLIVLAGSHKEGVLDLAGDEAPPEGYQEDPTWISNLTADLKYSLDKRHLAGLFQRYTPAVPKGPAGSVLLFHPNVVHSSAQNISPFDRNLAVVTYNSVENLPQPKGEQRPEFLAARDYTAVQAGPADLLLA
jgi:ectoine hydroxylase